MLRRLENKSGFTLIELLVVIAIIAILAAILFPVFTKAKQTAKQASCQSNLRQLSQALLIYADSNDGKVPGYGNAGNFWDKQALRTIKNKAVFRCPAYTHDGKYPKSEITYGINQWFLLDGTGTVSQGQSLDNVRFTTRVVLLYDGNTQGYTRTIGNATIAAAGFYFKSYPYDAYNTFPIEHNNGDNVAFCDGHVKWINTSACANELINSGKYGVYDWKGVSFRPEYAGTDIK